LDFRYLDKAGKYIICNCGKEKWVPSCTFYRLNKQKYNKTPLTELLKTSKQKNIKLFYGESQIDFENTSHLE
jgi:hypothetical protein